MTPKNLARDNQADFFGESYGANTAVMIAVRHPELVGRVATYGATFVPGRIALNPEITHYDEPPTAESRSIQFQRENYKKVAPDPGYWPKLYEKVGRVHWEGSSKEELASIKAPILVIVGDHDFVRPEHSVESSKLILNAELSVIPDASPPRHIAAQVQRKSADITGIAFVEVLDFRHS